MIAGPISDPLGLRCFDDINQALKLLLKAGRAGEAKWHARMDSSATMWKERSFWESIGMKPWEDPKATAENGWYQSSLMGPAEALIAADAAEAYLLSDRSTLLRQTAKRAISNTTVFFEPSHPNDVLLNSCFSLYATSPRSQGVREETEVFLKFMMGDEGQRVVEMFGKDEAGLPFFAPVSDKFSKDRLRGGRPQGGKWMSAKTGEKPFR